VEKTWAETRDVFVSFAEKNMNEKLHFVKSLKRLRPKGQSRFLYKSPADFYIGGNQHFQLNGIRAICFL